jgi:hypothetical protein
MRISFLKKMKLEFSKILTFKKLNMFNFFFFDSLKNWLGGGRGGGQGGEVWSFCSIKVHSSKMMGLTTKNGTRYNCGMLITKNLRYKIYYPINFEAN